MDIALYQINTDRDYNEHVFMDYSHTSQLGIDPESYDRVWEGHLEADTLDDVFALLNRDVFPDGYLGRSMSVSDICEVIGEAGTSRFFFVDALGFKEVAFDAGLARAAKEPEITVVACQPGEAAEVITLPNTLEALQGFCGGFIEALYPSSDPVAIICNEEGKLCHMPLNRAMYTEDGQLFDIIAGPMLVVGLTDDDFGSLRGDLLEKYLERYKTPEHFVQVGKQIMPIKLVPPSLDDRIHQASAQTQPKPDRGAAPDRSTPER